MNCPSCEAIIYSRRSGHRGVCGAELAADLLFTAEQRQKIEEQMKQLEADHRAAQAHLDRLTEHAHGGPFRSPRLHQDP